MKVLLWIALAAGLLAQGPIPGPVVGNGGGGGGLPSGTSLVVGTGISGNVIPNTSYDTSSAILPGTTSDPAVEVNLNTAWHYVVNPGNDNNPGQNATVVNSPGNLSNAAYWYAVSYVTHAGDCGHGSKFGSNFGNIGTLVYQGQETESAFGMGSSTATITDHTTAGQIALDTLPVSPDNRVVGRCIYRTLGTSGAARIAAAYFLIGEIDDNTTTTFTDNVSDATAYNSGHGLGPQGYNTTAGFPVGIDNGSSTPCPGVCGIPLMFQTTSFNGNAGTTTAAAGAQYLANSWYVFQSGYNNYGAVYVPPTADPKITGGFQTGGGNGNVSGLPAGGVEFFGAASPDGGSGPNVGYAEAVMDFEGVYGSQAVPGASAIPLVARKPVFLFNAGKVATTAGGQYLENGDEAYCFSNYEALDTNAATDVIPSCIMAIFAGPTPNPSGPVPLGGPGYGRMALNNGQDAPSGALTVQPPQNSEPGVVLMPRSSSSQASPLLEVVPYSTTTLGTPTYTLDYLGNQGMHSLVALGAFPPITGCGTISATSGGATAGTFTTNTTGTCTALIPLPTATHGWTCYVQDLTKHVAANILIQSASSASSCTVIGTTAANDVLTFMAIGW